MPPPQKMFMIFEVKLLHFGAIFREETVRCCRSRWVSVEMMFCFLDTISMPETQEMGGRADCQSVVERDCSSSCPSIAYL